MFSLGILLVIFLLFPRERLELLIMREEETNLDLSIIYIENLLSVKPDDRMKLSLAKKYMKTRDYKEAGRLLEDLQLSPLAYVRHEAFSLRYETLKREYFEGNRELMAEIEEELRGAIERTGDIKTLRRLYREGLLMNMPQLALIAAEKLSEIDRNRAYWLGEAYRQAVATSKVRKAMELAGRLAEVDRRRRAYWLGEAMRLAMALKDFKAAESYLARLGDTRKDARWYAMAAELYLQKDDYRRAVDAYVDAMRLEKKKKRRFSHFRRAIEVALWNEDYRAVRRLIDVYGRQFTDEDEMAEFILNSALATGDTVFAREIALNVLRHLEEKALR